MALGAEYAQLRRLAGRPEGAKIEGTRAPKAAFRLQMPAALSWRSRAPHGRPRRCLLQAEVAEHDANEPLVPPGAFVAGLTSFGDRELLRELG